MYQMILQPNRTFLEPSEMVDRIQKTFDNVEIDHDSGQQFLADQLKRLNKIKDSSKTTSSRLNKHIRRLEALNQRCFRVKIIGKTKDAQLTVTLIPNEPVLVSHPGKTAKATYWLLLIKLARTIEHHVDSLTELKTMPTSTRKQKPICLATMDAMHEPCLAY